MPSTVSAARFPTTTHGILTPREAKIAITSVLIYLCIYSFEAPIRYVCFLTGLNTLILFRDLLIIGPLAYIGIRQVLQRRLHPSLMVFIFLIVTQGIVFYLNYHAILPALLGAKLVFNTALGMLIGASIVNCSGRTLTVLTLIFVASVAGVLIEKFVVAFPWVGMSANIGGIDVVVSLEWGSDDPLSRRVGGFTRLSINVAGLLPILACIIAPKWRSMLLRLLTLLFAVGCVFLTTQKGSLVAIALVSTCLLLPTSGLRTTALRLLAIAGGAAQIILPFATAGMPMSEGNGGVFTASSFAARVIYTWPESLKYVFSNSVGPFGVGLGALGGPMRLIIPAAPWMFADNMFIFVMGYLGIFAVVLYGAVIVSMWRSMSMPDKYTESALAMTAFVLWYGTVITGFEDQVQSLAIGLALGTILCKKIAPVVMPAIPHVGRRIGQVANTSV